MSSFARTDRVSLALQEHAAAFINEISNRQSLITVTHVAVSLDLKKVTFFISIFPEERTDEALQFLKRKRSELREYIASTMNLKHIPHVDVVLDIGERARQHIDELLS